jgi:hypothetical protein
MEKGRTFAFFFLIAVTSDSLDLTRQNFRKGTTCQIGS